MGWDRIVEQIEAVFTAIVRDGSAAARELLQRAQLPAC